MIHTIENPENATRKLLELINESGKVKGYKINKHKVIYRNLLYVYTLTMRTIRKKLRKQFPL